MNSTTVSKKKVRSITPPLPSNSENNSNQDSEIDLLKDRIDDLERIIEDKDLKIENIYQEIIALRYRIEDLEITKNN
mgnify:CR=1 FL=1